MTAVMLFVAVDDQGQEIGTRWATFHEARAEAARLGAGVKVKTIRDTGIATIA